MKLIINLLFLSLGFLSYGQNESETTCNIDNYRDYIYTPGLHQCDLSEADFILDETLHRANFSGANLVEANFQGADLVEANFQGADLVGADFYKADLRGANFKEVYLYPANLINWIFSRTDFRYANLSKADFYKADLRGADFRSADLRGASMLLADLRGADFRGADLYGANLYGAKLHTSNLIEYLLAWKDFRYADFSGAKVDPELASYLKEKGFSGFVVRKPPNKLNTLLPIRQ